MNTRIIIAVLLVFAVAMPLSAKKKKKKTPKTSNTPVKVLSMTEKEAVLVIKGENKTFKITDKTKVFDRRQNEAAIDDIKDAKFVLIKTDPEDSTVLIEIKEFVMSPTKPGKTKKKK